MITSLLAELKRRKVLRVAGAYAVVGWGILQAADMLLPALGLPTWTLTFVAVLLLIGFPITLIIAWAFELTPDGLRRTAAETGTPPVSGAPWLEAILLVAILIAIGVSIAQMSRTHDTEPAAPAIDRAEPAPSTVSIAVLPFTSFSEDTESNYFADGLTEELINGLAQIADLKVSGRTSSFYFKDRNEDLREIGRQLGVSHVLEGSVRRAGDRLRITVQLISATDGFHLWSQTYDRVLDDIFAIQNDIAGQVAVVLQKRLVAGPDRVGATEREGEPYQLFLIATALLRERTLDSVTRARTLFTTVRNLEPDNVDALAGYAHATILLASAYLTLDFETAFGEAKSALEHALAIDPESVNANVAAGTVYAAIAHRTDQSHYRAEAERALAHAVALAPDDPDALTAYGSMLIDAGRPQAAIALLETAVQRDPLARSPQFLLSMALQAIGRFGEARKQLERLLDLHPDFVSARLEIGEMLMTQGHLDAAVPYLEQAHATKTSPRASFALANVYMNLGLKGAVRRVVAESSYTVQNEPIGRVILYNTQGDNAATLTHSEEQFRTTHDGIWRPLIVSSALIVGELTKARATLTELDPRLLAPHPDISDIEPETALYAANLLMREGDADGADWILNRVLERYAPPASGFDSIASKLTRAKALAQLGRNAEAMSELEAARLQGYRTLWDFDNFQRLDQLPMMAGLRDTPEFQAFVHAIESDNRLQREHILAADPSLQPSA